MKQRSKRPVKKQLRAIQTSQHLHVVHHKHSGHITPHRTTSYPVLALLLMIVGVFLAGWTHVVSSDPLVTRQGSYDVYVSVPGPPPSAPATIDSPTDGSVVRNSFITVKGSCPVNTYEALYRNGSFAGVALCDLVGHYEIGITLFPGANQLKVRDFSQTDLEGPWSNTVTVTYDPSTPVTPPGSGEPGTGTPNEGDSTTNTGGPVVRGEPLIFKSSFIYEGHYVGDNTSWQVDIEGGSAPYAVSVEWGDGTHTLISRAKAGTFTANHVYKKPGSGYRGSYVTKFSASDSKGAQTFMQLIAIVNNPPNAAFANGGTNGSGGHTTSGGARSDGNDESVRSYVLTIMKFIWPTYGVAVLLLASFWLGERREYQRLKPRLKKPRHA